MGAIAGVVDKSGDKAASKTAIILRKLLHRGTEAHGIATQKSVSISKSLETLDHSVPRSNIAIGHNFSRITSGDTHQPILGNGYALIVEGRFFPPTDRPDTEEIVNRLDKGVLRKAKQVLNEFDGSYAFTAACHDKIVAGRDAFGTTPLYYGQNESLCGLASERKALWNIGIRNAHPVPPGAIITMNTQGFNVEEAAVIINPPKSLITMQKAARHLQSLLLEATCERTRDVKKVAVAFSGGLDSSIMAVLAKASGVDVHIVSVGLKNQKDLHHIRHASNTLQLPLHCHTQDVDDVENVLPKVLWLIEEHNPVKVEIAIPLFWAAEAASRIGCSVLLAGQGGDEIFGGYRRYLTELDQRGPKSLEKLLYEDVKQSYKANFQRDYPICAFHKVELRLPFVDREVVDFALGLPLSFKIASAEDPLRKIVLRKVARDLGIPDCIAKRTKKAIQYSTGVSKGLKSLAKSENLTLSSYLKQLFYETYPHLGVSQ